MKTYLATGGEEASFYNIYLETTDYTQNLYDGIIMNALTGEKVSQTSYNWTLDQSNTDATWTLITDSFFKNLIVGIRYNGDSTFEIFNIYSNNALRYVNLQFMNNEEIEKLKGIISETGIVEKTIDYNEKWTTQEELIDYASSLLTQNTNMVNQIDTEFDIDLGLKVGDIVRINKPKFYINGKFVVTDIEYTYNSDLEENWHITLRNADLLSSFIDLFRPDTIQETRETTDSVMIAEYTKEGINEIHAEEV